MTIDIVKNLRVRISTPFTLNDPASAVGGSISGIRIRISLVRNLGGPTEISAKDGGYCTSKLNPPRNSASFSLSSSFRSERPPSDALNAKTVQIGSPHGGQLVLRKSLKISVILDN